MFEDITHGDPVNLKAPIFNFAFGFMSGDLPAGIGTYFINKTIKKGSGL